MSFSSMLAAHDDAALEALVSKGLVRRARRDLEAGLAAVSAHTDEGATVLADGQTVQIDARGPSAARCTCPAGGMCRHILLALMALRANGAEAAPAAAAEAARDDAREAASAIAEICALTQTELMKFAGANWDAAAALAAASEGVSIVASGRNCTIELAGTPVAVTFIAGQGLKKAVYKGPKSRARVVIAASAILLRAKHGVALETTGEAAPAEPEAPLAAEFLTSASDTLARAVRIVLAGSSPIAVDLLFELAISARAESAPRLTAQLRRLARLAGLAITRDVHFEPDTFLAEAARTFALIEALKRDSADPALTGSLRRDYRAHPAFDLWMLGASTWRSETGTRGLTLYGFAPDSKSWHSTSIARAAGQDPSFDPKAAYRLPLWAGPAHKLMGSIVHLPEPLVAADNSITTNLPQPARIKARLSGTIGLMESGASHVRWVDLRRDIAQRFGSGLKRRSQPVPALLAPVKFGGFAFDEFAQTYELEAIDEAGDAVVLTLPASAESLALRLRRESRRIRSILVEAAVGQDRPSLRPIAILSDEAGALDILNIHLDHWQAPKMIQAVVDAAQEALTKPSAPTAPPPDPLRNLATRATDAAASIAAGTKPADLENLTRSCEAAALITLANALERMAEHPDITHALAAAYIAGEIQAALMWS